MGDKRALKNFLALLISHLPAAGRDFKKGFLDFFRNLDKEERGEDRCLYQAGS
jgi:hypothetical protein